MKYVEIITAADRADNVSAVAAKAKARDFQARCFGERWFAIDAHAGE